MNANLSIVEEPAADDEVSAFSDSLIAIRKFMTPFRGIDVSVWATYAVAQYMICLAVLGAFLNLR